MNWKTLIQLEITNCKTCYFCFRNPKLRILWRQNIRKCSAFIASLLICNLLLLITLYPLSNRQGFVTCNAYSSSIFLKFLSIPLSSCLYLEFCCSYVCHAEVNAILNTNHASAAGQVSCGHSLSFCLNSIFSSSILFYFSPSLTCMSVNKYFEFSL